MEPMQEQEENVDLLKSIGTNNLVGTPVSEQ
jgi:hypothetical protein